MNETVVFRNELGGYSTPYDKDTLARLYYELQKENDKLRARLDNAIELPCKVGDTVYWVEAWNNLPTIHKFEVLGITYKINKKGFELRVVLDEFLDPVVDYYKDKNLFFDRAKAEAKLKEQGGNV